MRQSTQALEIISHIYHVKDVALFAHGNLDLVPPAGTFEERGVEAGGGCDFRREMCHFANSVDSDVESIFSAPDGTQFFLCVVDVTCTSVVRLLHGPRLST